MDELRPPQDLPPPVSIITQRKILYTVNPHVSLLLRSKIPYKWKVSSSLEPQLSLLLDHCYLDTFDLTLSTAVLDYLYPLQILTRSDI